MKNVRVFGWFALVIVLVFVLAAAQFAQGQDGARTVTFGVSWYDVGKAALAGLPGVKDVTSGWHGFMESNTVVFDPERITIEQMEEALKRAGTYRKTFR